VDFGKLPLGDGEVLPNGALDEETPDERRVMEATGNEGASFERAYHRAAIVLWPREKFADVLLQAGIGAVQTFFDERVAAVKTAAERKEAAALARRIIDAWTQESGRYPAPEPRADRGRMLAALSQLGDAKLLRRFIEEVVMEAYDGSENAALLGGAAVLGAAAVREVFAPLAERHVRHLPNSVIGLVSAAAGGTPMPQAWRAAAECVVAALAEIGTTRTRSASDGWYREAKNEAVTPASVADLLDALAQLDAAALRETAAKTIAAAHPSIFDPVKALVPALALLRERHGDAVERDAACRALWQHAAQFLLTRSEHPPEPPRDWRQDVALTCQCPDCRELQRFTRDPDAQTHRFRIRQDRRQHLHQIIERHDLDMTHLTERQGSPQTLVCTKTRRRHQRRLQQYAADRAAYRALLAAFPGARDELAVLAARIRTALERDA
jgi:hypothetical protein